MKDMLWMGTNCRGMNWHEIKVREVEADETPAARLAHIDNQETRHGYGSPETVTQRQAVLIATTWNFARRC